MFISRKRFEEMEFKIKELEKRTYHDTMLLNHEIEQLKTRLVQDYVLVDEESEPSTATTIFVAQSPKKPKKKG
jgi:hypothetical protein